MGLSCTITAHVECASEAQYEPCIRNGPSATPVEVTDGTFVEIGAASFGLATTCCKGQASTLLPIL